MNEFVAPPQEQNMHHQHPHSMVEPDKVNEIPNQIEIKQVCHLCCHANCFTYVLLKNRQIFSVKIYGYFL